MLSEWDQRSLAAIERHLRQDDPDLARRLEQPTTAYARRRLLSATSSAAIVVYLVGLIACVLL